MQGKWHNLQRSWGLQGCVASCTVLPLISEHGVLWILLKRQQLGSTAAWGDTTSWGCVKEQMQYACFRKRELWFHRKPCMRSCLTHPFAITTGFFTSPILPLHPRAFSAIFIFSLIFSIASSEPSVSLSLKLMAVTTVKPWNYSFLEQFTMETDCVLPRVSILSL